MPNFNLLAYKEIDRRLYLSSLRSLPLQLVLLPVVLPTLLFVVIIVELRRTQGNLDLFKFYREPEPSPETFEDYQDSESAAAPAPSRPRRTRCTCSCHRANGSTSKRAAKSSPGSCRSTDRVDSVAPRDSADPSPLGDSEGYETAAEEAAPSNTMQGTRATAHSGEETPRHNETPRRSGSNASTSSASSSEEEDEDEAEKVRRRNIKMREEGVRVKIAYSQLTAPIAPRGGGGGGGGSSTAATAGSFSSSGAQTPSTPTGSSSGSPASAFQSPAALQAPAHTPCSGDAATPIATPPSPQGPEQRQQVTSSVLPTSGDAAGPALVEIQEKLLAVPADAVSRRLLFDGRAILQRKVRTPRTPNKSVVFVNDGGSSESRQSPAAPAEDGKPGSGYPSELME